MKLLYKKLLIIGLSLTSLIFLSGCFPSGETTTDPTSATEATVELVPGAANKLVNNALTLTVIDAQRRPVSIFQGATITGNSNTSSVDVASSSDIIIEVDIKIAFNLNTFQQAMISSGETTATTPGTLTDLLQPGALMYIQGYDADGGQYISYDVVVPTAQEGNNELAINSKWDYDILNSALPATSVEANGSLLFKVSSTAKDLQLVIVTPNSGADPASADKVKNGNKTIYMLPLS